MQIARWKARETSFVSATDGQVHKEIQLKDNCGSEDRDLPCLEFQNCPWYEQPALSWQTRQPQGLWLMSAAQAGQALKGRAGGLIPSPASSHAVHGRICRAVPMPTG